MAEAEYTDLTDLAGPAPKARSVLARRLADIVGLPSSRLTPQERWVVGDLLVEILRASDVDLRARCADRLADIREAPDRLLRMLACDRFEIAQPILERSASLTDFDMLEIARAGSLEHRMEMARRKPISETVAAALAAYGEPAVVSRLLRNHDALLASPTVDHLVSAAKDEPSYAALLIKRAELRPAQGLRLFWWCDHADRRRILERFGVERSVMIDAASDVFPLAAEEGWNDPLVRRTLEYIDRRQRDRKAAEDSPHGSLEGAIEALASHGPEPELVDELARLARVERELMRLVVSDMGGESLAVLCKATGVKWSYFEIAWASLGRASDPDILDRARAVYDGLSVERAQTVLRYWNISPLDRSNR
jgi:uncharacterized protein (DUF2336 family)